MDKEDLFALKEEIEDAKTEISELKGEQKAIIKQLNENWECSKIKDGRQKIEEFSKELRTINKQLFEILQRISSQYEQ